MSPGPKRAQKEFRPPELAEAFGLYISRGAVISEVVPDTSADKVGLERGDDLNSVISLGKFRCRSPAHHRAATS